MIERFDLRKQYHEKCGLSGLSVRYARPKCHTYLIRMLVQDSKKLFDQVRYRLIVLYIESSTDEVIGRALSELHVSDAQKSI